MWHISASMPVSACVCVNVWGREEAIAFFLDAKFQGVSVNLTQSASWLGNPTLLAFQEDSPSNPGDGV